MTRTFTPAILAGAIALVGCVPGDSQSGGPTVVRHYQLG